MALNIIDTLTTSYSQHVLSTFGKQCYLATVVSGLGWHFDAAKGLLSFGNAYRWEVQLLGTESQVSNTWLWAWANEGSQIPTQHQGAALAMRLLGDIHQSPELTEPEFPLGEIDGHYLATIASGVVNANAYYRCPYEGGAAFVLIRDENFPKDAVPPLQRLATVFPQAISAFEIQDHQLALIGYLDHHGIAYQQEGSAVLVKDGEKPILAATFDELNRLTNLEVTLKPEPAEEMTEA